MARYKIQSIYDTVLQESKPPEAWLAIIDRTIAAGDTGSARDQLYGMLQLAAREGDDAFRSDCLMRLETIQRPVSRYEADGAADRQNTSHWDVDSAPFRPPLQPEKIYLAVIKIPAWHVKGPAFWFVVHKVLCELNWLDDKRGTKFVEWVGSLCRWEWDTVNPWKNIPAELKNVNVRAWNERTIQGNNNGKYYRNMADALFEAFRSAEDFY